MDKKTVYGINKSTPPADLAGKKHHSRAYDRHFEGYEYHMELAADGKEHLVRTYTGCYYEADLSPRIHMVRKLIYLALYGVSAVLLILYGQCSHSSAEHRFLAVPEMLTLFALLWLGTKLIFYVTAPKKMTIGEYKGSCVALQSAAKATAGLWAVTAVLFLAASLVSGGLVGNWVQPFVCLCLGCAATVLIYSMETRLAYRISA